MVWQDCKADGRHNVLLFKNNKAEWEADGISEGDLIVEINNIKVNSVVDVQKALKSAEKGLEVWKNTAPWQRSYVLRKIADLMREKKDVLAKWLTLEVGKPLAEGVGEVGGGADIFEWNAEETKRIYGQTQQSRFPDTRVHVYYQPVGVVAALIPWNFPIVLASRKISTALAAGCSVICKPDTITPGTVMELVNICKEAGVPDGVINLLSGDPAEISNELMDGISKERFSIIPYFGNVKKTWDEISKCNLMISTRLHASIFACYANVPFILIEYHKKCSDFLNDVGQQEEYRVYDADVSPKETLNIVINILKNNYNKPSNLLETIALSKKNFTETLLK